MKTIKRTISMVSLAAVSALGFAAGCIQGNTSGESEAGEAEWPEATEGEAVTLEGTVVVSVTTYEDGLGSYHSETELHLKRGPEDEAPLRLHFDGDPPDLETGDEISVAGKWQIRNDIASLAVEDVLSSRAGVGNEDEIGQSSQAVVSVRPPKDHRIAVLLIGPTSTTVAQAQAMINAYSPGSAASFIGESSGLVDTFRGDVFSYPEIDTSNCANNVGAIKTAARNEFEADGHKLADYTNIAFVIGGGCNFVANGTINAPGSSGLAESTYNDNFHACTVVAHELGHNLGFQHAGSTACGTNAIYKASRIGCTDKEYGHIFDMMGSSGGACSTRGHYSVMHKRYAGYLSKCEDVTAGGSAVFRLSAAEGSCGMRSLRIPIAGESNYYYLEFRKPGAGEFSGVSGQSRVLLTVADDPAAGKGPTPYLLDATPATSAVTDAWLQVGTTYNLPGSVSIKVLSIADIAKVQVTMPAGGGAKCQDGSTPPSSGGEVGGLCGAVAAKTYQAENRTFQKQCTESSGSPGYQGTGYMDFGGAGSIVEMGNVEVPRYGSYKLTFRYANGTAADRTSKISVNDQAVGTLPFGGTGGWSSWGNNAITVTLKKGINKIRVTSIGNGPNLDSVLIATP